MPQSIERDEIYKVVLSLLEEARGSGDGVLYYFSVSCCPGFYTQGMSTFVQVVSEIRNLTAHGKQLDLRFLLEFEDQPIDHFALHTFRRTLGGRLFAERFRCLEASTARDVAHSVSAGIYPDSQFYIAGRKGFEKILITSKMARKHDPVIDHFINELASGTLYEGSEAQSIVDRYKSFFLAVWDQSHPPADRIEDRLLKAEKGSLLDLLKVVPHLGLKTIAAIIGVLTSIFSLGYWSRPYIDQLLHNGTSQTSTVEQR